MNYIYDFFKGILIGSGAILPGISSGVLCVIFGIYDKLISSIIHFFDDIKSNFKFLLPIFLGIGIGVILLGNIIKLLFEKFYLQTNFLFIGLILGTVPILFKTLKNFKEKHNSKNLLFFLLSFLISLVLILTEKSGNISVFSNNLNFVYLFLCGFFMSIGVVVPGVSSTVILMILGVYNTYLTAISSINMAILFPMGLGLIVGGFICLKIIEFLFKKFYLQTYYSIIGFVCGSVFILYKPLYFNLTSLISIFCLFIGFIMSKKFEG